MATGGYEGSGGYEPTTVAPRRRRGPGRKIAIVVGVIVLACCAGSTAAAVVTGLLSPKGSTPTSATAGGPGGATDPTAAGLNQAVRDGKFEFVVTEFSCGHPSVGQDWWAKQPQGQFCLAQVSVSNIGSDPQRFADGVQKGLGPDGTTYAADTGAGVVANGNGDAVWNIINPGNAISAFVVFDIPTAALITTLELHDSALSHGVRVNVSGSGPVAP